MDCVLLSTLLNAFSSWRRCSRGFRWVKNSRYNEVGLRVPLTIGIVLLSWQDGIASFHMMWFLVSDGLLILTYLKLLAAKGGLFLIAQTHGYSIMEFTNFFLQIYNSILRIDVDFVRNLRSVCDKWHFTCKVIKLELRFFFWELTELLTKLKYQSFKPSYSNNT